MAKHLTAKQAKYFKKRQHVGPTMIQRSRRMSASEKASYHQITGAGKRHVLRQFFGLNARDEEAIVTRIEQQIDKAIREGS